MFRLKYLLFVLIPIVFMLAVLGSETAVSSGTFTDSGQLLGSNPSYDVAMGDLDGDTDLDAFVANFGSGGNANTVWLNDGNGTFTDSGQQLGSSNSYHVALGDVDNDGDLDAFIGNSGANIIWLNQGGLQGGTQGTFSDSGQALGTGASWGVALGDIDADGDLDAVTANAGNNQADKVWFNQGGDQGGTIGVFSDSGQNLGFRTSGGIALGDVDGDTDLDVFITHFGVAPNGDRVWLNNGSGTFSDSGQVLGTNGSAGVSLADLDSDGDLDAFVGFTTFGSNQVWLNQGGLQGGTPGIFQDNGQTNLGGLTLEPALGDVDEDGDVDVFLAHYFNGAGNTVWLNDGSAQFSDSGQSLGSANSYGLAMGDVDGDLDLDVFVANYGSGVVGDANKVWLNQDTLPTATPTVTATPTATPTMPPPVPPGAEGWQRQLVDKRGDTGYATSLALDSHGRPHIAYSEYLNPEVQERYQVKYTYWDGIQWHTDTIDRGVSSPGDVRHISLVLDGQDHPHLAYQLRINNVDIRQMYAHWDGSSWQIQEIDEGGLIDTHSSIALDSDDQPHISFAGQDGLTHAFWNGTSWESETIDNADGKYNSIAMDGGDYAHISYRNGNDYLKYAYQDALGWHTEVVDSSLEGYGPDTSLALDNLGSPHIAYLGGGSVSPEYLQYAYKDGNTWQYETVIMAEDNLLKHTSLMLDSANNPHFVYGNNIFLSGQQDTLHYLYWDGAMWQDEVIDASGGPGLYNSVALDVEGKLHVSYQDSAYNDLVYTTWDKYWQTQTIDGTGVALAPDMDVAGEKLAVSYYDQGDGRLKITQWAAGMWQENPVAFMANNPALSSLSVGNEYDRVSYYDGENQQLMYGRWDGSQWQIQLIDDHNDAGQYNDLLGGDSNQIGTYITYWDATTFRVKAARLFSDGSISLHTNVAGPPLNASSGYLSGGLLQNEVVVVSYYDGIQGNLRVASWNEVEGWTDELVDGDNADVGQFSSLEVDIYEDQPVIAYYDATNEAIKIARRDETGWQITTVAPDVGPLTQLDFDLGYNAGNYGRLTYISQNDNTLYAAFAQDGVWQVEGVVTDSSLMDVSLAAHARLNLAFTGPTLQFASRLVRPGIVSSPTMYEPPDYNPLAVCLYGVLYLIFSDESRVVNEQNSQAVTAVVTDTSLEDEAVFSAMTTLFSATPAGQNYINLYAQHVKEMGQIALHDPQLMIDSYGTLQNFLPGLEALVTGKGNEQVVTQEMVDDALDIWTRIMAQASPELVNVINRELAQSNNLQNFVGLTFAEWAEAIGVDPPQTQIYLPLIVVE